MICFDRHRIVHLMGILIVGVSLMVGCTMPDNRVVCRDVNVGSWHEPMTISFSNEEARHCDIDLLLHVNSEFKVQQCEFEIETLTPDSLRYVERVSMPVMKEQLLPTGHLFDITLPYRRNVELAKNGEYNITITPLIPLSNVEAVGVNFQLK